MKLSSVSEVYTQSADCCHSGFENELRIETHDGGGGWYLTLHTNRWALDEDEIGAFVTLLKTILGREPK